MHKIWRVHVLQYEECDWSLSLILEREILKPLER